MNIIKEEILNQATKLYLEDKLSIWNIANKLNIRYSDLRPQLKQKIQIRKVGESSKITNSEIEKKIANDYINKISRRQLSEKYNLDRSVINRILREKNIKLRNIFESNKKKEIDEKRIINLYNQGLYCSEVAKLMDLSTLTITRKLRKNNIQIRDSHKSNGNNKLRKFNNEQEKEIINNYLMKNMSCGELSRQYKTSHCVISSLLKRNNVIIREGRIQRQKYTINENYFEQIYSPNKYFILGVLYTDGSNMIKDGKYSIGLELQAQDKHIIEYTSNEFNSNKPLSYCKIKNTWKVTITNKRLSIDLSNLGCVPNKTYNLKFPTWLNNEYFSHFLHGLIVGDGCFYKFGKIDSVKFGIELLGTIDLIEKCVGIIKNKLNIPIYVSIKKESNHLLEMRVIGLKNTLKLSNFIFNNTPMIMIRKYLLYEDLIKYILENGRYNKIKKSQEILQAIEIQKDIRNRFGNLIEKHKLENKIAN